jgi:nickel-dependent lactate racemase
MPTKLLRLPFGDSHLSVRVPRANLLGVFAPEAAPTAADGDTLLREALAHPTGTAPLRALARPGQRVVIVTSDTTRPCPSDRMLPPILDELAAAGVPDSDITIVVALGLHHPMGPAELEAAVGPVIYRRARVINHDPADTVQLGVTVAGTPVEIFRPVVEADLRICLGNLEFHYFAGYSGGAKAILPGCASEAAIRANHAMMVHPEATAGRIEGNPVRVDLEEGARMVGVDFILNVLVDGEHRIVGAVAGNVIHAHRQGCEQVVRRGRIKIPRRADIVLASAGGHPKDIDLYQAQKALDNASHAVRKGGVIVLAAECGEGLGNRTFEEWMIEAPSTEAILARIQREFALGGHKAAAIAGVLQEAHVYLVSELPHETVRRCGMIPFDDLDAALAAAFHQTGDTARVVALPQAGSVLPSVNPSKAWEAL